MYVNEIIIIMHVHLEKVTDNDRRSHGPTADRTPSQLHEGNHLLAPQHEQEDAVEGNLNTHSDSSDGQGCPLDHTIVREGNDQTGQAADATGEAHGCQAVDVRLDQKDCWRLREGEGHKERDNVTESRSE